MSTRVFKYEPDDTDRVGFMLHFTLPKGARVINVDFQHGDPVIWAIVDSEAAPSEPFHLTVVGTGWELPIGFLGAWKHWRTVEADSYVWHVFVNIGDTNNLGQDAA